jgi:hypothetical protein
MDMVMAVALGLVTFVERATATGTVLELTMGLAKGMGMVMALDLRSFLSSRS